MRSSIALVAWAAVCAAAGLLAAPGCTAIDNALGGPAPVSACWTHDCVTGQGDQPRPLYARRPLDAGDAAAARDGDADR